MWEKPKPMGHEAHQVIRYTLRKSAKPAPWSTARRNPRRAVSRTGALLCVPRDDWMTHETLIPLHSLPSSQSDSGPRVEKKKPKNDGIFAFFQYAPYEPHIPYIRPTLLPRTYSLWAPMGWDHELNERGVYMRCMPCSHKNMHFISLNTKNTVWTLTLLPCGLIG